LTLTGAGFNIIKNGGLKMNAHQLVKFYGNEVKAAAGVGVSQQSIRNWLKINAVPEVYQLAIQSLTDGKLKADKSCFK
jgi:hypothetical protein